MKRLSFASEVSHPESRVKAHSHTASGQSAGLKHSAAERYARSHLSGTFSAFRGIFSSQVESSMVILPRVHTDEQTQFRHFCAETYCLCQADCPLAVVGLSHNTLGKASKMLIA